MQKKHNLSLQSGKLKSVQLEAGTYTLELIMVKYNHLSNRYKKNPIVCK